MKLARNKGCCTQPRSDGTDPRSLLVVAAAAAFLVVSSLPPSPPPNYLCEHDQRSRHQALLAWGLSMSNGEAVGGIRRGSWISSMFGPYSDTAEVSSKPFSGGPFLSRPLFFQVLLFRVPEAGLSSVGREGVWPDGAATHTTKIPRGLFFSPFPLRGGSLDA